MKIAIVIDHLTTEVAGTEGQVVKLIRGLAPQHEIHLIALRSTPWLDSPAARSLPCKVTVFDLRAVKTAAFWLQLRALFAFIRELRPDVVHSFFPIANIIGVIAARRAGVPVILSSRRDYGYWMTPRYLAATRFANRFLTGIVTNSPSVKELTIRAEGFDGSRIQVIYNGVDVGRFAGLQRDHALKAQLGIPAHWKVITLVANYRPIKRHDLLIDALARLAPSHPDACLLFIGEDSDDGAQARTMALVEQRGLRDRVFTAHAKGDIERYLSIADIGVNCSDSEGLSNAVVEYMCAGVPSVVTRGGGNVDLVRDGINGLSCAVGDAAGLAACLARFLDDEALRSRCAQESLSWVSEEMSLPAIVRRFEACYAGLLAAAAHGPQAGPGADGSPVARAKALVRSAAGSAPVMNRLRRKVAGHGVTVLMYHELGGDDDACDVWQIVRRGDFLRQVDYLRRHYEIVPLDRALEVVEQGAFGDRPLAVLTFDDGHRGNAEHLLPIVRQEGLPVTIYVATGHIEDQRAYWFDRVVNALQRPGEARVDLSRHGLGDYLVPARPGPRRWVQIDRVLHAIKSLPPARCDEAADEVCRQVGGAGLRPAMWPMTREELRAVAAHPLVTIGAHSHGHEALTLLPLDEARLSIDLARQRTQEWLGRSVQHFAYPSGLHDAKLVSLVREMGFASAMSNHAGHWRSPDVRYEIPRISVGRYDSLDKFKVETVLGLRGLPRRLLAAA